MLFRSSGQPSRKPSSQPTSNPTSPTGQPSAQPTNPTGQPSAQPSSGPSIFLTPIRHVKKVYTASPSINSKKASYPTLDPSSMPTHIPTFAPSALQGRLCVTLSIPCFVDTIAWTSAEAYRVSIINRLTVIDVSFYLLLFLDSLLF